MFCASLTAVQGKNYFFVQSWLGILVLFLVQGVPFTLGSLGLSLTPIQVTLQARLYALYHESNKILALMVSSYVCEIAAVLTIWGFLNAGAQRTSFSIHTGSRIHRDLVTNNISPTSYICANAHDPSFYRPYVFWLLIVVYDSILCLLALWRGVRT